MLLPINNIIRYFMLAFVYIMHVNVCICLDAAYSGLLYLTYLMDNNTINVKKNR